MNFLNDLNVLLGRKRWTKRIFRPLMREIAYKEVCNGIKFHYCPKDMEGPSFHFGYDLEKGFLNYEEKDKVKLMKLIPEGGVFYDIGANIGMFSAFVGKNRPDVQVYSFEPEKKAFECLSETIKASAFKNVIAYNVGIASNAAENASLFVSSNNDGGHSLKIDSTNDAKPREVQKVKLVCLGEFQEKMNLNIPDVIKIDVEGFEADVLNGIYSLVEKYRPTLLVECQTEDILNDNSELRAALAPYGNLNFVCSAGDEQKMNNIEDLKVFAQKLMARNHSHENYLFNFKD